MRLASASIAAMAAGLLLAASAFAAPKLTGDTAAPLHLTTVAVTASAKTSPAASHTVPRPGIKSVNPSSWGVMKSLFH